MKRLFAIVVTVTLLCLTFALPVAADIGPKPSVRVTFVNAPDTPYYATLLSERKSTGPASAWDGTSPCPDWILREYGETGKVVWEKFIAYTDADGYYFLQDLWECTETDELAWTYYPPTPFKILVYYPDTDTFAVSGVYERYAFDAYYTVDLAGDVGTMTAEKTYDYSREIVSLVSRIVLTIAIEYLVALAFGYREKRWLGAVMTVNAVTQVGLNAALNAVNFYDGAWAFVFWYVVLEIAVCAAEAVAYTILHRKFGEKTYTRAVAYACVANLASFAGGLLLARLLPGIF